MKPPHELGQDSGGDTRIWAQRKCKVFSDAFQDEEHHESQHQALTWDTYLYPNTHLDQLYVLDAASEMGKRVASGVTLPGFESYFDICGLLTYYTAF